MIIVKQVHHALKRCSHAHSSVAQLVEPLVVLMSSFFHNGFGLNNLCLTFVTEPAVKKIATTREKKVLFFLAGSQQLELSHALSRYSLLV